MLGLDHEHGKVEIELVRVVERVVFLVGDEPGRMPRLFLVLVFDILTDNGNVAAFEAEKKTGTHGFLVRIYTNDGIEWREAGWISAGEHWMWGSIIERVNSGRNCTG